MLGPLELFIFYEMKRCLYVLSSFYSKCMWCCMVICLLPTCLRILRKDTTVMSWGHFNCISRLINIRSRLQLDWWILWNILVSKCLGLRPLDTNNNILKIINSYPLDKATERDYPLRRVEQVRKTRWGEFPLSSSCRKRQTGWNFLTSRQKSVASIFRRILSEAGK